MNHKTKHRSGCSYDDASSEHLVGFGLHDAKVGRPLAIQHSNANGLYSSGCLFLMVAGGCEASSFAILYAG